MREWAFVVSKPFRPRIVTMNLGEAASRESAAENGFEDWRRSAEMALRNPEPGSGRT
jgi:hypothetical protein